MNYRGFGVNLLTPFTETNEIDFENIEKQIEIYLSTGASAIFVGRQTGEFFSMEDDEIISVIQFVVEKVNKRAVVFAHTGFNDTSRSIKLSIRARLAGADALVLLSPYYVFGNVQSVHNHFKSIALSAGIPCYIENDFSKTGLDLLDIEFESLSRLNNVVGIIENSSDITNYSKILVNAPEGFEIICANDSVILPALSLGVNSFVSTVASLSPSAVADVIKLFGENNIVEARDRFLSMLSIYDVLTQEVSPIPIKTAINMLGYNVGDFRLPLGPMETDRAARLATFIMDQNIEKIK